MSREVLVGQNELTEAAEAAGRQRHEVRPEQGLARPQRDQRDCQRQL